MRPVEGVLIVIAVCCLSLDVRTMGRRMLDGFNSGHDRRKKSTSTKNSPRREEEKLFAFDAIETGDTCKCQPDGPSGSREDFI